MLPEPGPLRVLMVAARYFPYVGGLETHVHEVGRRLARMGVKVTILTTDVSHKLPFIEESEGMQVHRVSAWPSNKDYYFAPGLYRMIVHGQWDLVHCQGYHNLVAPLAMLAACRANMPFVLSFHSGGDITRLRKALRGLHWMMLRPLLLRAQKLIAVSEFEAGFFRERLRLPTERFVVIPNGTLPLPKIEGAEAVTNETNTRPLIISIGRLERYKGHQRLIAALPRIQKQLPETQLLILGTGPYETTLRRLAQKLGVAEHVEIRSIPAGDRQAMANILSQASLVALLSEYEGHPIAIMEALALRRPVLVTDTSGLRELAEQKLALAIPLNSTAEEVATAVIREFRQPLVPQSVALPTWDACASSLLALYQTVTGRVPCAS